MEQAAKPVAPTDTPPVIMRRELSRLDEGRLLLEGAVRPMRVGNSRQLTLARLGVGSTPWRRRMFQTLLGDSGMPSPTNSPWIRL